MSVANDAELERLPAARCLLPPGLAVEGYASLFWAKDLNDDVVAAGAFAESLAKTGPRGVKMLHGHDAGEPVGVWDEVREDARGLWVRGRISGDTARGRMTAALVRTGALDGLSIGFRTRRARGDGGRLRVLSEVELWEVSIVTFPMLPGARLKLVSSEVGSREWSERADVALLTTH